MTGFTQLQKRTVRERDQNQCQLCGKWAETVHHRGGRGMGGSKAANRLSNACILRDYCNTRIEQDPNWAAWARRQGVKISKFTDPAKEVLRHRFYGPVFLTDTGTVVMQAGDDSTRPLTGTFINAEQRGAQA